MNNNASAVSTGNTQKTEQKTGRMLGNKYTPAHSWNAMYMFVCCFTIHQHLGHYGQNFVWMLFNVWPTTCMHSPSAASCCDIKGFLPSACPARPLSSAPRCPNHGFGSFSIPETVTYLDINRGGRKMSGTDVVPQTPHHLLLWSWEMLKK
jgi:hypothetical protein